MPIGAEEHDQIRTRLRTGARRSQFPRVAAADRRARRDRSRSRLRRSRRASRRRERKARCGRSFAALIGRTGVDLQTEAVLLGFWFFGSFLFLVRNIRHDELGIALGTLARLPDHLPRAGEGMSIGTSKLDLLRSRHATIATKQAGPGFEVASAVDPTMRRAEFQRTSRQNGPLLPPAPAPTGATAEFDSHP